MTSNDGVAVLLAKTPSNLLSDPTNAKMLASILVDSAEQSGWEDAITLAGRIMSLHQSDPETCSMCCTALLGLYNTISSEFTKVYFMNTLGSLTTVMPTCVKSTFVKPALHLLDDMASTGLSTPCTSTA